MRIIAGKAGSLPIKVPEKLTRPTTDRVREAVFSSLGERVAGASVLDLFAGSGSLGMESLSRGASTAAFVDSGEEACRIIEDNLRRTRLQGGQIYRRTFSAFLSTLDVEGKYDIIFADPPYARDDQTRSQLEALLRSSALRRALHPSGIFVLESFAGAPLPDCPLWKVAKEKKYGKTRVSYLCPMD